MRVYVPPEDPNEHHLVLAMTDDEYRQLHQLLQEDDDDPRD